MYFQFTCQTRRCRRTALSAAMSALMFLGYLNAAAAQSNPSADEIINLLRPSATRGLTTRGIRPVNPSSETAPSAAEVPVPTNHAAAALPHRPAPEHEATPVVSANGSAPSVNLTVNFAFGSARLTDAAAHTLDELGRALSSSTLAGYKFRVEGHTDTKGNADTNRALSQARALTVVDYLATRFNIDRTRLIPIGMGQEGLLIPTPPETPEPRNRRVQVVNLGT